MLVHVRLLQYPQKQFTYEVPQEMEQDISLGTLVQVPIQHRTESAVVDSFVPKGTTFPFALKAIKSIYPFPQDAHYRRFIEMMSHYYQVDSFHFLKRIQKFLQETEKKVDIPSFDEEVSSIDQVTLTQEQRQAYETISKYVQQGKHKTCLLHGVTGSGKTEVYKKLIADAVAKNSSIFLLLPEVSLALQFEKIIAQAFPDVLLIGFHSATTIKQKRLLWKALIEKKIVIIVGVHLPILLPISNLGLVIVDEEHEAGYQEKKHPKLHSRDMAIVKASIYGVPIVLGSATPSIQSLWNVKKRDWKLVNLQQRFAGNFPHVQVVSLKDKQKRKHFWITDQLYKAIIDRLERKEQVIIFLNRRGHSFFVQCTCSYVFACMTCSVSLTLHSNRDLVCHYCGYKQEIPHRCPSCQKHHEHFLKKGIGTQQVVEIVQHLFPQAVVARADADTTVKKRTWQQTVQDMLSGDIDILVGTQSITKGYHFPGVTLVGVLWADLNLHFPMYNAAETTLQQLIQVAGRAGRQSEESNVIIQTFDDHPIYTFLSEQKYIHFYNQEIEKRAEVGYPPYKHIAEIEIRHKEQDTVEEEAQEYVELLEKELGESQEVDIFGPVQAVVYRVKGVFAQKIMLKSFSRTKLMQLFSKTPKKHFSSSLFFTIDPV